MQRLILFRHAKTEARAAGGEDIDRALIDRGRSDAGRMGQVLADAGMAPDLVLVSPAVRARETWTLASAALPPAHLEIRDGLYDATPEEVARELTCGVASAHTVMVVGHNPSLHELAIGLLETGDADPLDIERVSAGFPTATAATFRFDAAGAARLEALFHVRDQGGAEVGRGGAQAGRLTRIFKILPRRAWEAALSLAVRLPRTSALYPAISAARCPRPRSSASPTWTPARSRSPRVMPRRRRPASPSTASTATRPSHRGRRSS